MREATNGQYPRYCVWENVCFDADTLVTCEDGYRRIADVSIGQKVKTLSGRYLPVVKVHQTKNQEVIRLHARGGEDLIVTPNHPFYAMKKIRHGGRIQTYAGPEWVAARDLTPDHLVAYGVDHPSLPDDFMTEEEAWALGRWLADGSVDLTKSNPRMFFSIGMGKEEEAREKLGRLPYRVHENKPHSSATNFCFTSKEFYALIAEAGIGAGNKRVPSYVFQLPFDLQRMILDGYISGDGYVRVREHVKELTATTASRELAYGICRLIRNVYRIPASISTRAAKNGNIDGREIKANYPCYEICAYLESKMEQSYVDDTIVWQSVKSVEKLQEKRTVYNLSILEDNTYAANDVIVHNCGAFSSNSGADFRSVLEAIISVKEEGVQVPAPENHRWPKADILLGDGWSVAYRVLDAQYFGVPQRRARIYLVADFNGESAGEVLFKSDGLSGYSAEGFRTWQRAANGSEDSTGETDRRADAGSGKYCLNPQGCSGITVTEEQAGTLVAQDHGNHPAVLQAAGFSTEHSAKARSIGYEEEKSPTLRAGVVPATLSIENHPTDGRVKIREDGKCQTLCSRAGTGGNNVPLVAEPEIKAYGVCSKSSHSMLSENPKAGFYEAETSRTLDQSGGNPCSNQGGICIVAPEPAYSLQGSMIGRADKNGPQGDGVNEEISFTLNTSDRHAVAAPSGEHYSTSKNSYHTTAIHEQAGTLVASDYKDPPCVNDTPNNEPVYIVRRLTPVECARLQGFPDWWCSDLAISDPTEEQLAFWLDVWNTWQKINGKPPKNEKQIRRWLADPYSDSAEYKLWGNGVSLPIVYFVLSGIAWVAGKDEACNEK